MLKKFIAASLIATTIIPATGTFAAESTSDISNGKVKSITTFLGNRYMDGVSWRHYNHIRSWETIYDNGTKVDFRNKGNINYTFNLSDSNYTATFLEELKV